MNPESTYLEHLASIERIAAFVARRGRLNSDEAAEFVQVVRVRLFEDDYAIIRKFEGRSSFSTYLTTVILRLFHQCRVEQWGKWRPSAEARRLGDHAVDLERLLTRDGYTLSEAIRTMTTHAGAPCTASELEALYLRLPCRNPRPVVLSDEVFPDAVAVDSDADERIETRDRERAARKAAEVVDRALLTFEPEDRVILQMRFWDGRRVADIARILRLDQKKVYKRLDKLFALIRRALEAAGVEKRDIEALLQRGDQEVRLPSMNGAGNAGFRPSHPVDAEEMRGSQGNAT